MTTIDAGDVCRGCTQPWRPGELFCSACGTARSGGQAARQRTGELRRPGVVLAAQIMIGLSVLGDAIMLLLGLTMLPFVVSLGAAADGDGPVLFLVALAALIMLLAFVVLQVRAIVGIERRERSARTIVTVLPVIDAVVALVLLLPLGLSDVVGGVGSLLFGLPWSGTIIGLLWLPLDAKRWLRDLPVTPGSPPPPQPADDGDWWAAEARRARNADNVPQTKRASRPRPVEPPSTGRHARPSTAGTAAATPEPAPPTGAPSFPVAPPFPSGPTPPIGSSTDVRAPRQPSLPRAAPGAPQLPRDYGAQLLARAGFPATPHNLAAVHERLAVMFRARGLQFIEGLGTARDRDLFMERCAPADDPYGWAQLVLNALVHWRADSSPHIQDFYERYSAMLLEDVGSGSGFFGGSADQPLPTMDDWR